jgi:small subunit ribosomal protein S13
LQKVLEGFYGIGGAVSRRIMARLYIHPTAQLSALSARTVTELNAELSHLKLESDLRREVRDNIARLRDMGTYRGRRHAMNLPVRGQNTSSQVRRSLDPVITVD